MRSDDDWLIGVDDDAIIKTAGPLSSNKHLRCHNNGAWCFGKCFYLRAPPTPSEADVVFASLPVSVRTKAENSRLLIGN